VTNTVNEALPLCTSATTVAYVLAALSTADARQQAAFETLVSEIGTAAGAVAGVSVAEAAVSLPASVIIVSRSPNELTRHNVLDQIRDAELLAKEAAAGCGFVRLVVVCISCQKEFPCNYEGDPDPASGTQGRAAQFGCTTCVKDKMLLDWFFQS
jgi:hypothetical protein